MIPIVFIRTKYTTTLDGPPEWKKPPLRRES